MEKNNIKKIILETEPDELTSTWTKMIKQKISSDPKDNPKHY